MIVARVAISASARASSTWKPHADQPLKGRDVVTAGMFDRALIDWTLGRADLMGKTLKSNPDALLGVLRGKVLANTFMEPSTRTSSSFQTAMMRLGGSVLNLDDQTSSAKKGETLHDTFKVLDSYADVHVLRHPKEGSAKEAAAAADKPLINAGDGGGEHPTQALLDMFCITSELGRLDNLNVVLVGDLLYGRTVHSLAQLLAHTKGLKLTLASPKALRMPREVIEGLGKAGVNCVERTDLPSDVVAAADVVYQTRVQRERFPSQEAYDAVANDFLLNRASFAKLKKTSRILHPLPRVNELATDIDSMPQAAYFKQPWYGLVLRMTLLAGVLGRA